jgi:hypothetical protein
MESLFHEAGLAHIRGDFIDYSAFTLAEGEQENNDSSSLIWERYVHALLEGTLQGEDTADAIQDIPPEKLARIMNSASPDTFSEESYDRVITSYIRKSSERTFSSRDLKKILDFINDLKPEIKRQFLSATVGTISKDLDVVNDVLQNMTGDDVLNLLSIINEQMVIVPEALQNILSKFSKLDPTRAKAPRYGGGLIEDDFVLSPEVTGLLAEADFKAFVTDAYQNEIQNIIRHDTKRVIKEWLAEVEHEWKDEYIEGAFHRTILELISSDYPDLILKEDYKYYIDILIEQVSQFLNTGQYDQMLLTFKSLESNTGNTGLKETVSSTSEHFHSTYFIGALVDSFRGIGRQSREDVYQLCNYYGEKIIPFLIDALIEEESPSVRKFMISLIAGFGDAASSEALSKMKDKRWFVTRNMLFILMESGSDESLKKARPYCNHENPRVSFEAIKCLLKAKDDHGVHCLRKFLRSDSRENIKKSVVLAGAFKVGQLVPDLLELLRKKAVTGADLEAKIPIVRTLGQIGNPEARTYLEKILSSKTFLYKGSLEKLKDEVRATLHTHFECSEKPSDADCQTIRI